MIYTPLTKLAMKIAYEVHRDQKDKNGLPYIFHPFHLAEQMDDEASTCVALLHDVVEDSDTTIDDLRKAGFPEDILTGVALMTHEDAVPYLDYVRAIKKNPLAVKVKLADLAHNSDTTRLDVVDDAALLRLEKYRRALQVLQE